MLCSIGIDNGGICITDGKKICSYLINFNKISKFQNTY